MKKTFFFTVFIIFMVNGVYSQIVEKGSKTYKNGSKLTYEYYLNEIGDEILHGMWSWYDDEYTYTKGQYVNGKKQGEWIYRSRGSGFFGDNDPRQDSILVVEHYSNDGLLDGIRETHAVRKSTKLEFHSVLVFRNGYCVKGDTKETWYDGNVKKQSIYHVVLSEKGVLIEDWGEDPALGKFHCYYDEHGFCKQWNYQTHPHQENASDYSRYYDHKNEILEKGWFHYGESCYGLVRDTVKKYYPYESILAKENPFIGKEHLSSVFSIGDVTSNVMEKFIVEYGDICDSVKSDYEYFRNIIGIEVENFLSGKSGARGCYKNIWEYFQKEKNYLTSFCSNHTFYGCKAIDQYESYCKVKYLMGMVDTVELYNNYIEQLIQSTQRTNFAQYVDYKGKYEKFLSITSQLVLPEKINFLEQKLNNQIKEAKLVFNEIQDKLSFAIDSLLEKHIEYSIGKIVKFSNNKYGIDLSIRNECAVNKKWCEKFYTEVAPKEYKKYDGSYAIESPQEVKLKELFHDLHPIVSYKILKTQRVSMNVYQVICEFEQRKKQKRDDVCRFFQGSIYVGLFDNEVYILLDYSLDDLQEVMH